MQLDLFRKSNSPLALAYGMGVDSSGLLVKLGRLNIRPEAILFADTGAEKQETYDFEPIMQDWLKRQGFPPITTVSYVAKEFKNWPPYYTLEDNCLTNGTLPGISFGPASCSVKWKQAPQHQWMKEWEPARAAWDAGERVVKMIGFDASPRDRARTYAANPKDAHLYDYRTPLIDWGIDREECARLIADAGLPVPPKSACFFCLAMKPWEVDKLPIDKLRRIVRMEARAAPRLRTCEGLWRSTVKGLRGAVPHPGSMTDYILQKKLLPADEVQHIRETTFSEIISFQEGYAQAKADGKLEEFMTQTTNDYRTKQCTSTNAKTPASSS